MQLITEHGEVLHRMPISTLTAGRLGVADQPIVPVLCKWHPTQPIVAVVLSDGVCMMCA